MFHEEVLGSKQRAELETNVDLPEEKNAFEQTAPWKKVGRDHGCTKEEWQVVNEQEGRQGTDCDGPYKLTLRRDEQRIRGQLEERESVWRGCAMENKSVFYLLCGDKLSSPFHRSFLSAHKKTLHFDHQIFGSFSPPPSSSQILAGCPRIQLNSDTIYQEICIRYHRLLSKLWCWKTP